jgi:hypothetical protein
MSLQHARGRPLDAPSTALLTACFTGVAQGVMAEPIDLPSRAVQLAASDIDEAIGGCSPTVSSRETVDGLTVPAGFARIEAFRTGLANSEKACFER